MLAHDKSLSNPSLRCLQGIHGIPKGVELMSQTLADPKQESSSQAQHAGNLPARRSTRVLTRGLTVAAIIVSAWLRCH